MFYFRFFIYLLILFSVSCDDEKSTNPDNNKVITYDSVVIGEQVWMKHNLNVTHYRNGDIIHNYTDPEEWAVLDFGAWCYYDNDSVNGEIFGKLYNAYAMYDPRGLAPEGWRIATDDDWKELERYLGIPEEQIANSGGWRGVDQGGMLKDTGLTYWAKPNVGATNVTGFTALPGGIRLGTDGKFIRINYDGYWWTKTDLSIEGLPVLRYLSYDNNRILRTHTLKTMGFSIRCIKDE